MTTQTPVAATAETETVKTVKIEVPGSPEIAAAIQNGDIITETAFVQVKELKTRLQYEKRIPVTEAGARALVGGQMDQVPDKDKDGNQKIENGVPQFKRGDSVVGLFFYGHDLTVRNYVRTKFLNETAAPEKKDENRIKMLMAAGYDRETAEQIIKNAPNRAETPTA